MLRCERCNKELKSILYIVEIQKVIEYDSKNDRYNRSDKEGGWSILRCAHCFKELNRSMVDEILSKLVI